MQWETAPELLQEMVDQSLSVTQVVNLSADISSSEKGNNGSQPSEGHWLSTDVERGIEADQWLTELMKADVKAPSATRQA